MAVTQSGIYTTTLKNAMSGTPHSPVFNLALNTYKISILDQSTTTPNFDGTAAWTTSGEVVGTNWTTTGKTLATSATGGTDMVPAIDAGVTTAKYLTYKMTGALSVATVTFTGGYAAIIYADPITTPNAKPSIVLINFGAAYGPTAGTFGITWDALGVFRIQLAT
jgi:hypothetical protein